MPRNYFFSYHHRKDWPYLSELRQKFKNDNFKDYGFKDVDLGESSKFDISKHIQSRLWSSSITIVLIGEKTGDSAWIDWEIWYSLQNYKDPKVSRRRFKPKGLIALYLPNAKHNVPKRLKANIDSGYAVELNWKELDSKFYEKANLAYSNRKYLERIRNDFPLTKNPRTIFERLNPDHFFSKKFMKDWITKLKRKLK